MSNESVPQPVLPAAPQMEQAEPEVGAGVLFKKPGESGLFWQVHGEEEVDLTAGGGGGGLSVEAGENLQAGDIVYLNSTGRAVKFPAPFNSTTIITPGTEISFSSHTSAWDNVRKVLLVGFREASSPGEYKLRAYHTIVNGDFTANTNYTLYTNGSTSDEIHLFNISAGRWAVFAKSFTGDQWYTWEININTGMILTMSQARIWADSFGPSDSVYKIGIAKNPHPSFPSTLVVAIMTAAPAVEVRFITYNGFDSAATISPELSIDASVDNSISASGVRVVTYSMGTARYAVVSFGGRHVRVNLYGAGNMDVAYQSTDDIAPIDTSVGMCATTYDRNFTSAFRRLGYRGTSYGYLSIINQETDRAELSNPFKLKGLPSDAICTASNMHFYTYMPTDNRPYPNVPGIVSYELVDGRPENRYIYTNQNFRTSDQFYRQSLPGMHEDTNTGYIYIVTRLPIIFSEFGFAYGDLELYKFIPNDYSKFAGVVESSVNTGSPVRINTRGSVTDKTGPFTVGTKYYINSSNPNLLTTISEGNEPIGVASSTNQILII